MRKQSVVNGVAVGVMAAGMVSGCGDRVTAARDWTASGTAGTGQGPDDTFQGTVSGPLTDANGNAYPGQSFRQVCNFPLSGGGEGVCTLTVITANRVYVAQGATSTYSPFGIFKSLGGPGSLSLTQARVAATREGPVALRPSAPIDLRLTVPVRLTARP